MKKQSIKTAKTVEEATALACAELGVNVADVTAENIHVLHAPKKSFFSFLKQDLAEVEVVIEVNKKDLALEYIHQILEDMKLSDVSVSISEENANNATILLDGEGVGTLIGRHGETLDALQYLTGLACNKIEGDYFRVTLDSGNYREKRKKTLEALARRMAINASKTGRSVTLEPMNPYERRIIHSTVQQVNGASSTSIGEEPNRRVVISSTNPRPRKPRNPRDGENKTERSTDRGGYRRGPRKDNRVKDNIDSGEKKPSPTYSSGGIYSKRERKPLSDIDLELPAMEPRQAAPAPVKEKKSDDIRTTSPDQAFGAGLYSKIDID